MDNPAQASTSYDASVRTHAPPSTSTTPAAGSPFASPLSPNPPHGSAPAAAPEGLWAQQQQQPSGSGQFRPGQNSGPSSYPNRSVSPLSGRDMTYMCSMDPSAAAAPAECMSAAAPTHLREALVYASQGSVPRTAAAMAAAGLTQQGQQHLHNYSSGHGLPGIPSLHDQQQLQNISTAPPANQGMQQCLQDWPTAGQPGLHARFQDPSQYISQLPTPPAPGTQLPPYGYNPALQVRMIRDDSSSSIPALAHMQPDVASPPTTPASLENLHQFQYWLHMQQQQRSAYEQQQQHPSARQTSSRCAPSPLGMHSSHQAQQVYTASADMSPVPDYSSYSNPQQYRRYSSQPSTQYATPRGAFEGIAPGDGPAAESEAVRLALLQLLQGHQQEQQGQQGQQHSMQASAGGAAAAAAAKPRQQQGQQDVEELAQRLLAALSGPSSGRSTSSTSSFRGAVAARAADSDMAAAAAAISRNAAAYHSIANKGAAPASMAAAVPPGPSVAAPAPATSSIDSNIQANSSAAAAAAATGGPALRLPAPALAAAAWGSDSAPGSGMIPATPFASSEHFVPDSLQPPYWQHMAPWRQQQQQQLSVTEEQRAPTVARQDAAAGGMQLSMYDPSFAGPHPATHQLSQHLTAAHMAAAMAPIMAHAAVAPAAMLVPAVFAGPAQAAVAAAMQPHMMAAAAVQGMGLRPAAADSQFSSIGGSYHPGGLGGFGLYPAVPVPAAAAAAAANMMGHIMQQQYYQGPGSFGSFAAAAPSSGIASSSGQHGDVMPSTEEAGQEGPSPDSSISLQTRSAAGAIVATADDVAGHSSMPGRQWSLFRPFSAAGAAAAWLLRGLFTRPASTAMSANATSAANTEGGYPHPAVGGGVIVLAANTAKGLAAAARDTAAHGLGIITHNCAAAARLYMMALLWYSHYQLVLVLYALLGTSSLAILAHRSVWRAGSLAANTYWQLTAFAVRQVRLFMAAAARVVSSDLKQLPQELLTQPLLGTNSSLRAIARTASGWNAYQAPALPDALEGTDDDSHEGEGGMAALASGLVSYFATNRRKSSSTSSSSLSRLACAQQAGSNKVEEDVTAVGMDGLQQVSNGSGTLAAAPAGPPGMHEYVVADSLSVISGMWVGLGVKLCMLMAVRVPYETSRIWVAVGQQGCCLSLAACRAAATYVVQLVWLLLQCSLLVVANTKVNTPNAAALAVAAHLVSHVLMLPQQVVVLWWTYVGAPAVVAGQGVLTAAAVAVPGGPLLLQLMQASISLCAYAVHAAAAGAMKAKRWLADEEARSSHSMQSLASQLLSFALTAVAQAGSELLLLVEQLAVVATTRVLQGVPPMAQAAVWGSAGMLKRLMVEAAQQSWLLVLQLYQAWQQQQQQEAAAAITA